MTNKYIPTKLNDLLDQDDVKLVLSSILKNTKDSPKYLLFEGPNGTGKTVATKIFNNMLSDTLGLSFYSIFNANLFNDEDYTRIIIKEDINVVVIKYIDELDFQKQSKLIKYITNLNNKNSFFIFITENINKVLTELKDIALILNFNRIKEDTLYNRLKYIIEQEDISIEEEYINKIVDNSKGSISLALELLEVYKNYDIKVFDNKIINLREYLIKLYIASFTHNKDEALKSIENIVNYPLELIKESYELLTLEILKTKIKVINKRDKYIDVLLSLIQSRVTDIFNILNNKLMYDMFDDYLKLESALWYLYIEISKLRE